MFGVELRANQAQFLAKKRDEQDTAFGPRGQGTQRCGDLHDRSRSACIVVGAVENAVRAGIRHADVIVVGRKNHVGVAQYRVGATQQTGHIADLRRDAVMPPPGVRGWRGSISWTRKLSEGRGLEVAIVACGFKSSAAELGGDVSAAISCPGEGVARPSNASEARNDTWPRKEFSVMCSAMLC